MAAYQHDQAELTETRVALANQTTAILYTNTDSSRQLITGLCLIKRKQMNLGMIEIDTK